MKIIEKVVELIDEELCDAKRYIKLADKAQRKEARRNKRKGGDE